MITVTRVGPFGPKRVFLEVCGQRQYLVLEFLPIYNVTAFVFRSAGLSISNRSQIDDTAVEVKGTRISRPVEHQLRFRLRSPLDDSNPLYLHFRDFYFDSGDECVPLTLDLTSKPIEIRTIGLFFSSFSLLWL
jgi:hypothetical protein